MQLIFYLQTEQTFVSVTQCQTQSAIHHMKGALLVVPFACALILAAVPVDYCKLVPEEYNAVYSTRSCEINARNFWMRLGKRQAFEAFKHKTLSAQETMNSDIANFNERLNAQSQGMEGTARTLKSPSFRGLSQKWMLQAASGNF